MRKTAWNSGAGILVCMMLHCFPAKSEVTLKLTAAICALQIIWCTGITLRIIPFIIAMHSITFNVIHGIIMIFIGSDVPLSLSLSLSLYLSLSLSLSLSSIHSRKCLSQFSLENSTAVRKKHTFEECSPVCSEGYCQLSPESLFLA